MYYRILNYFCAAHLCDSDARLSGSFLEIYGEDVFDLLNNKPNRPSLPLREAKNVVTVEHLKQVRSVCYG